MVCAKTLEKFSKKNNLSYLRKTRHSRHYLVKESKNETFWNDMSDKVKVISLVFLNWRVKFEFDVAFIPNWSNDRWCQNPTMLAGPRLLSVNCAVGMAKRPSILTRKTRRGEAPHSLHTQRAGEQQLRWVVRERSGDWSVIGDGGRPGRQTPATSWHLSRSQRRRHFSWDMLR